MLISSSSSFSRIYIFIDDVTTINLSILLFKNIRVVSSIFVIRDKLLWKFAHMPLLYTSKAECRVLLFEIWPQDQQYQQYLSACKKCRLLGPHQNYWITICILTILPGNLYTQNKFKEYWSTGSSVAQTIYDESVLFWFLNFQSVTDW